MGGMESNYNAAFEIQRLIPTLKFINIPHGHVPVQANGHYEDVLFYFHWRGDTAQLLVGPPAERQTMDNTSKEAEMLAAIFEPSPSLEPGPGPKNEDGVTMWDQRFQNLMPEHERTAAITNLQESSIPLPDVFMMLHNMIQDGIEHVNHPVLQGGVSDRE